ncbi:amidohydrolase [Egibacter rhizosphaerae]|uniref:Amidohydrolase n=1 Tax=Egibacter rhizosphaerae TaxID=1670831 RepID=A0A411YF56_9ACTN|nr:amidohydrolase family protein [Egibacter rhizosphaerae]QBI19883.1 amidohydrolase [Egibacter rhizosphaerae]
MESECGGRSKGVAGLVGGALVAALLSTGVWGGLRWLAPICVAVVAVVVAAWQRRARREPSPETPATSGGAGAGEDGTISRRVVLGGLGLGVAAVAGGAGFYLATRYPAGSAHRGALAIIGGTVLVGPGLDPRRATVVVRDGVIEDVGDLDVPGDATVLDADGATILPGLIDLHVHVGSPELDAGEEPGLLAMPGLVADWVRYFPRHRRSALEHGVTAVRSLGDEHPWIADLRRQVGDRDLEGPRLFLAGPMFTTRGGHPVATFGADPDGDAVRVPTTPASARAAVRALATADDPVDLVKVVQERGGPDRALEPLTTDVLEAIVDEAHAQGFAVTAHWGTFDDLRELLNAGVDGLEHLDSRDLLEGWPDDVLAELVDRGLPVTATLAVAEASLPEDVMGVLRERVGELHAVGGRVVVGSDAARPGVGFGSGVHRELALLVDSGLTPRAALRAATSDAADVLGVGHIGAVEAGRAADLLVVDGDPLVDIDALRDVRAVLRDGRRVVG